MSEEPIFEETMVGGGPSEPIFEETMVGGEPLGRVRLARVRRDWEQTPIEKALQDLTEAIKKIEDVAFKSRAEDRARTLSGLSSLPFMNPELTASALYYLHLNDNKYCILNESQNQKAKKALKQFQSQVGSDVAKENALKSDLVRYASLIVSHYRKIHML